MTLKRLWTRAKALLRILIKFFTKDIWFLNLEDLSHPKAAFVKIYTFMTVTIKDFGEKKIGIMSASLSYFCSLAVVPFLAVCFALTGGFGLSDMVDELLRRNISDPYITDLITNAADNIISSAQKGGFGLVSSLLFVWLVIWMMMRVEKVFNDVWRINDKTVAEERRQRRKRNFFASFGIDLTILVFAPFIIVFFFIGSIVYSRVLDIVIPNNLGFSNEIKTFVSWLVFAVIVILILSAMYKYIPSTKVRYKNAFQAAIYAGIAFTLLQFLYLETQVLVTRINAVYGTIAAIPLFLAWLRFGWMITMLGAQLSYSLQNYDLLIKEAQKQ